jgi:6-phosphogluconolactonase
MRIEVYENTERLGAAFARFFSAQALGALAARPSFRWALAGGSAARLYGALAREKLPWARIHFYWGDERMVPPEHADSNFRAAREALLSKVPVPPESVHRVHGEMTDAREAAALYAREIHETGAGLDFVHLGMGSDGHICSLFPGHPLLDEGLALAAAIEDSPKPPARRVTLTLPALRKSDLLCFTVMGKDKAGAVRSAIEDLSSSLPAALAARGAKDVAWFLDRDAASQLSRPGGGEWHR